MSAAGMYGERADLYDRIYTWKDYAGEAARLRAVLRAAGVPDGARILEAACGTGSFLAQLRRWYDVTGFDISDTMLAECRRKLPDVRTFRADMTELRVAEPYDAVVCLFSSIGHVPPERLDATAAGFFAATRPGGVVLVEPWITPEQVLPGKLVVQHYDGGKASPPEPLKLVRAVAPVHEGRRSILEFHWLVVTPAGVEHLVDRMEAWQSTGEELVDTFERAGFDDVAWLDPGPLMGRGCILARRPA